MALAPSMALTRPAAAQAASSEAKGNERCGLASQVLDTGQPAPLQAWAQRVIISCGADAPAALTAGMRRLSASNDTADANALRRAALYIRDAAFLSEALSVARSSQATNTARVTGFVVAALQLNDRVDLDLNELLASTDLMPCRLQTLSTSLRLIGGDPLPADAVSRVLASTASVLTGSTTSVSVANAARCAETVAKLR